MRTIIILCLALLIALSFGCSKKKEEPPKTESAQEEALKAGKMKPSPTFDVVSMEELETGTTPYSYEYGEAIYYFTSAENMEAFKANPEKYVTPSEPAGIPPQNQ